jgi:hypothetical protein
VVELRKLGGKLKEIIALIDKQPKTHGGRMKGFGRIPEKISQFTALSSVVGVAAIVSSCTSHSSVSVTPGGLSPTSNFYLNSVCPNGTSCVNAATLPSISLMNTIMSTPTYAENNPNQPGFFPAYSYEFKGSCDVTTATLQVAVAYTSPTGASQAPVTSNFGCSLAGLADFVLTFTNGDGMYGVTVTPLNLSGQVSGTGANVALYALAAKPSITNFTISSTVLTNVRPHGTAIFTGPNSVTFGGGGTSATLTIIGTYDNAPTDYVSAVVDTTSGLGQPVLDQVHGTFTDVVQITPSINSIFTFEEVDLAGNVSAPLGFTIYTHSYVIPQNGTLAGAGLPLSGPVTGGTGNQMMGFTLMPFAHGNQTGVASTSGSGAKLYIGTPAIAAQGPSKIESSNP